MKHADQSQLLNQQRGMNACEADGVIDALEDNLAKHNVWLARTQDGDCHVLEHIS
jgi:hypothetical protein